MNSACCIFWIKNKNKTNHPPTPPPKKTNQNQNPNLKLALVLLKEEIVTLAGKIIKGNTLHCHPHHFPTSEPLPAPSGRGGLTRLDWADPGATTTTLIGSESLSDLEYKISGSLAFVSFSFTGFNFFKINPNLLDKNTCLWAQRQPMSVTLSWSAHRMCEEFVLLLQPFPVCKQQ